MTEAVENSITSFGLVPIFLTFTNESPHKSLLL